MDSNQHVSVIGLAWYELDDFTEIKAVMVDGNKLPKTYSEWRLAAEQTERKLRREGRMVVRAHVRPAEFVAWCSTRGLNIDANARMAFANEVARETYRAIQEGHNRLQ